MALLSAGGGAERVDLGFTMTSGQIDQGTMWCWVYIDSASPSTTQYIFRVGSTSAQMSLSLQTNGQMQLIRVTSSVNLQVSALLTNFSAWAAGKWIFLSVGWDRNASASTDMKMLLGDLTTLAAEPSAYAARNKGSGTFNGPSGNAFLMNVTQATFNRSLGGRLARFGMSDSMLNVAQQQALQFGYFWPSDARTIRDLHGTGNQPDWLGTNPGGIVTTATATDHPGIARLRSRPVGYLLGQHS